MPNYAITSRYNPFSFQERIAPLQMMKEEYDKVGESLAEYSNDATAYYQYLDPQSKSAVDKYNQTLNSVADSLSRDGLKAVSRNTLFDLRRMYNNQIAPINKAAESAARMYEDYRKLAMQDPTLIIGNMPTVSDLMSNPNALPTTVSGATLYKQGAAAASQIPNVTYEQLNRYLAGDTSAIPNIDEIQNTIGKMYGLDNLPDSSGAYTYILQGIRDGISERTAQFADTQNKLALQHEYDIAKINAQTNAQIRLDNIRTANDIRAYKEKTNESIRLNQEKAALSGGKSSGSGVAYDRISKGTTYIKGDKEYNFGGNYGTGQESEGKSAMRDSKAKNVTIYELSDENKRVALRRIGQEVLDEYKHELSGDELNILIKKNLSDLSNYTYRQYLDPKNRVKNNEFVMNEKNIIRDVGIPESYYDNDDDKDFLQKQE